MRTLLAPAGRSFLSRDGSGRGRSHPYLDEGDIFPLLCDLQLIFVEMLQGLLFGSLLFEKSRFSALDSDIGSRQERAKRVQQDLITFERIQSLIQRSW